MVKVRTQGRAGLAVWVEGQKPSLVAPFILRLQAKSFQSHSMSGRGPVAACHPPCDRWGLWASERGRDSLVMGGLLCKAQPPPCTAPKAQLSPCVPLPTPPSGTEPHGGQTAVRLGQPPGNARMGQAVRSLEGGSHFLGVSDQVTHSCFPEKMAFVGFKGSFRPTWVTLDTEDQSAKIFQVVPIPVVRKKRL